MSFHQTLGLAEIHQIHNREFANAAARTGGSYAASDVNTIVKQTDDDSYYIVLSTTPTFLQLGTGGGGVSNGGVLMEFVNLV